SVRPRRLRWRRLHFAEGGDHLPFAGCRSAFSLVRCASVSTLSFSRASSASTRAIAARAFPASPGAVDLPGGAEHRLAQRAKRPGPWSRSKAWPGESGCGERIGPLTHERASHAAETPPHAHELGEIQLVNLVAPGPQQLVRLPRRDTRNDAPLVHPQQVD